LQLPKIDPLPRIQVTVDRGGNRLTPALALLCSLEPALELSPLFFERQIKQTVGRSDGDLTSAHSRNQLLTSRHTGPVSGLASF
jgi:hypothetical protein